MQIIHASPEDARVVAQIHVDSWREAYKSILPAEYLASLSVQKRQTWWEKCIADGKPELLVANSGQTLARACEAKGFKHAACGCSHKTQGQFVSMKRQGSNSAQFHQNHFNWLACNSKKSAMFATLTPNWYVK
jgi:hypothetical protein